MEKKKAEVFVVGAEKFAACPQCGELASFKTGESLVTERHKILKPLHSHCVQLYIESHKEMISAATRVEPVETPITITYHAPLVADLLMKQGKFATLALLSGLVGKQISEISFGKSAEDEKCLSCGMPMAEANKLSVAGGYVHNNAWCAPHGR
jgi:hypothetical protein